MTETQEAAPDSWDTVDEEAKSKGPTEFLKFKTGEKVRLRVIFGPVAFCQLYTEFAGGKRKGFNLPKGTIIPGQKKPRAQYAFEVLILDGPEAGVHKIWTAGQKIAEQLSNIRSAWGDVDKCDLVVGKTGEKLETEWSAIAVPPSKIADESLKRLYNLREKIKFATKEEIESILPQTQTKDSMDTKASTEQIRMIGQVATTKELTDEDLDKMCVRKFSKKKCQDLTVAEASQLIELLRAY